jgi:hypothetical protein
MPETAWKCDVCGGISPTEERAQSCEDSHVQSRHMKLVRLDYDDGARLPSSITFQVDPNVTDGEDEFLVRYVFDAAGMRGL